MKREVLVKTKWDGGRGVARVAAGVLGILLGLRAGAETFTATNEPGTGTLFTFAVPAHATNLTLSLTNSAAAFSHLYLRRGASASTNEFDFVARAGSNSVTLNLELPELAPGSDYALWVFTPPHSAAHAFTVVAATDRPNVRQPVLPAVKPLAFTVTGTLNAGESNVFQVDFPAPLPGWRVVLSGTGFADADVYVQRDAVPGSQYLKASTGRVLDTVFLHDTNSAAGTCFVAVTVPKKALGNMTYTLRSEVHPLVTLDWDPGLGPEPAYVYTNPSRLGGDYFFKIVTTNTTTGIWRTRLGVSAGDANLFLKQNAFPTESTHDHAATRMGSDGVALAQPGQCASGQTWYVMVLAQPDAAWTLVSGSAYIPPLPPPAADGASGTNGVVAPEGINFYRTTIPANTPAWRLGLNGLTNQVLVQRDRAAHPASSPRPDWNLPGQLLLVPPYLKSGGEYFVSVMGTAGEGFTLDSRPQPVVEVAFESTTPVAATDYGYVTYRVMVPAEQVGWQVDLRPTAGTPHLAVREAFVGNEFVNTAFVEPTNAQPRTVTLVPPTLRDNAYYVTVYGAPPFAATLASRRPSVQYVPYRFQVTNALPADPGWRFYGVTNIEEQAASLGWELLLQNQVPGTELALRRNRAPGRWQSRSNFVQGAAAPVPRSEVEFGSTNGFLQRPQHTADIWYIGVNHPAQPAGSFVLTGRDIPVTPLDLAGEFRATRLAAVPAGFVQYFRVTVPPDALALEARLANVTSGAPRLAVGRDLLPVSAQSLQAGGGNWTSPNTANHWPSGAQIYHETDWTGFTTAASGTNQAGQFFFAGRGNPLVPGTYHLGVFPGTGSGATNPITAELRVRGLFQGTNIAPLPFAGGTAASGELPAQDSVWYRVEVPSNQPSWKLRVEMPTNQEGLLLLRHQGVANYGASQTSPTNVTGVRLRKGGDEHFLLLPTSPATNIPAGLYYLGLVSEGRAPAGTRAGTNTSSLTVTSVGPLPLRDLLALDPLGQTALTDSATQAGGEVRGYRFTVREDTPALEIRLKDRVGNPRLALRADGQLPALYDAYGVSGGATATWSDDDFIRIPSPAPGEYTLLIQAAGLGGKFPDAAYTLEIKAQGARPLDFNLGLMTVTNQPAAGWEYFRVTVPTNCLGWDLRFTNITQGDPRMVVCRERIPANLTTRNATGGSWTPFTSTNWPAGFQLAPDKDWTGHSQSATGANQAGQVLMVPAGNPLEPGVYIIGVTGGGTPGPTNYLSYQLLSRGIGPGFALPVHPLDFADGVGMAEAVPPREATYFRVEVPSNAPSWQVRLETVTGDSLLALRRGGLPNFGAGVNTVLTNLAGCLLQRANDEHFVLLPFPPATNLPAGDYYLAVVSEGVQPGGGKIGSDTASARLRSRSPLALVDLGRLDTWSWEEIQVEGRLDGGELVAYRFEVRPGTVAVVTRLDNRTGNPVMTLRAGAAIPRSTENYGRQGGWPEDWKDPTYLRIPGTIGGEYHLVVQAGAVSGKIVPATYTLRIYSLVTGTVPLAFDGGARRIQGHTSKEWIFFSVDVPPEALGWDLRLKDVSGSDPAMVICRDDYPRSLASTFTWATATNWPVGGQVLPGLDWTGYRTNAYQTRADNKIFAAGMGCPLGPGRYVIGITSSDPKAEADMNYTIASRGIGAGFLIPVLPLEAAAGEATLTALEAGEAAYFSVDVPEETPGWKLRLRTLRGDALLAVRRDGLPSVGAASNLVATAQAGGHKVQKVGDEHLFFGTPTGVGQVPPGRYFVAVVSEGESPNPALSTAGTGSSDCVLESRLPAPVTDLGWVPLGGDALLHTHALPGGDTALYQFTLPAGSLGLEVKLEAEAGRPLLRLRSDGHPPLDAGTYGQDGNFKGSWEGTNRIAVLSPTGGVYQLTVHAGGTNLVHPDLAYRLRVRAEAPISVLSFDAGRVAVTNQPADLWKTYLVEVPPRAAGWEVRLTDVLSGDPRLVICREAVPLDVKSRDELYQMTNWPGGWQLAPALDWTGRSEADGSSSTGRVFQVGMGNPLTPGIYYVGITNFSTQAASYTLTSRGIGSGFSIPVHDLPFANGVDFTTLAPRESAWYRVTVPSTAPSWKIRLAPERGEALLLAQRDALPHIRALVTNRLDRLHGGKLLRKPGDEHLLYLAAGGTNTTLPGGTYYLGVVGEGVVPTNSLTRIGTNETRVSLWSEGSRLPVPLGTVGVSNLVAPALLAGGESATWQFRVAEGTRAVEVWLPRSAGAPTLTLTTGDHPPGVTNAYGVDGGAAITWQSGSVITVPNPAPTNHALTVQAGASAGAYPEAQFEVRVRALPIDELSFDPALNRNGRLSTASATIEEDHRAYFRVEVPQFLNDEPVIGWRLSLSSSHGTPLLRVRKHALPDDRPDSGTSGYVRRQAVFVPEFLSPGTWYVEVKAGGLTRFTLGSEALRLDRPAWVMPAPGEPVTTPGLPAAGPVFGDTGLAPDGSPLPGLYVDLELDSFHYYAIRVPERNLGLLRTELIAYNGDPNLYLRWAAPPTLAGQPVFDRALTNAVGTEYGNWVPLDGKTETRLAPGWWYLAVHASGGANVRYRLRAAVGDLTELDFQQPAPTGLQILAAGDWRYYRVLLPVDMTGEWEVTLDRIAGDMALYVRDTLPPGLGTHAAHWVTWKDDARNHGPYPVGLPPGTHRFTVPPLRPGTPYYLGVRALSDARFALAAKPVGPPVTLDAVLPFVDGQASGRLPAGGWRRYRVDTPANARRFQLTALNPASVRFHLDQGSLPTVTSADHWVSSGANATLERQLYDSSWPWLAGFRYFLTVTNTARDPQNFSFRWEGRDCSNDDHDRDGLPDCWESAWFGSIYTYGPESDPDHDGLNNLAEYQAGGDPMSADGRLQLAAPGFDAEGRLVVLALGRVGQTCRVQASATLATGDWTDVLTFVQTEPVQAIVLPLTEPTSPRRFFRLVSP